MLSCIPSSHHVLALSVRPTLSLSRCPATSSPSLVRPAASSPSLVPPATSSPLPFVLPASLPSLVVPPSSRSASSFVHSAALLKISLLIVSFYLFITKAKSFRRFQLVGDNYYNQVYCKKIFYCIWLDRGATKEKVIWVRGGNPSTPKSTFHLKGKRGGNDKCE